jgi:hypothetical protein
VVIGHWRGGGGGFFLRIIVDFPVKFSAFLNPQRLTEVTVVGEEP